uniref:Uncharacterized protein n=1 Tax=Timema bartmani TaxID=61472 RepID=A0A7R9EVP1_9NEOP|nr:unnamed protein product [Timema bartmani]
MRAYLGTNSARMTMLLFAAPLLMLRIANITELRLWIGWVLIYLPNQRWLLPPPTSAVQPPSSLPFLAGFFSRFQFGGPSQDNSTPVQKVQ